ncbi:MAG: HEAT repeat domain-containing protein [Chloroflexota bacterium]
MIDERAVQALKSKDVEQRKRAIMTLAKSRDRRALPYLARVYKGDPDPAVRELARKGGIYIKKYAPDEFDDSAGDDNDYAYAYGADSENEDALDAAGPAPVDAEVKVSRINAERARGLLDQAMDTSVAGKNEETARLLQRAFKLDPSLMRESMARSLASTVTGLSGEEAVQMLGPGSTAVKAGRSSGGAARFFALLMMIAGALMIAGTFLPWEGTLLPPLMADVVTENPEIVPKDNYTGMDIITNTDDVAVTLSLIETIAQILETGTGPTIMLERNITSYSPALVVAVGAVQVLTGLLVMISGSAGAWYWFQGMGTTLAAAAGLGWFYITLTDLYDFRFLFGAGAGGADSVLGLLEIGFWLAAGGTGLLLLAALIGSVVVGSEE